MTTGSADWFSRLGALASVLVVLAAAAPARAEITEEEAKSGPLTFCSFGPKVKMLEPRREPEKKGCVGGAKIQGVQWICTTPDKAESHVQEFRKTLVAEATKQCKAFCAKLAPRCEGKLDSVFRCGLQTDREDAVVMGQRLGCRKDCTGKAFAYCSLYNIGFLTDDVKYMETQPTNCHCLKADRSR